MNASLTPQSVENNTITASYKWTRDEFVAAQISYARQRTRPRFKSASYVILLVLWIYAIWYAAPGVWQWFVYLEAILLSFVVFAGRMAWAWIFKWRWKQAQQRESDNVYYFSPESIMMKTRFGDSTLKWGAFIKILEVKRGFLFFQQPRLFFWVPFHAFESPTDVERVRDLITRSEIPFKAFPSL